MNGLQSVAISFGKRIRCLPLCPPGTRGSILVRRLANSATEVQGPPESSSSRISPIANDTAPTDGTIQHPPQRDHRQQASPSPSTWLKVGQSTEYKRMNGGVQTTPHLNTELTGLTAHVLPPMFLTVIELIQALEQREPKKAWHSFVQLQKEDMTSELTRHAFSNLLLSVRPDTHVSFRSRLHLNDNGDVILIPIYRSGDPNGAVVRKYPQEELFQKLFTIVGTMEKHGYQLGTREYLHLLECARACGNAGMAERLWNEMAGKGVHMDTYCYNSYIGATCGTASTEREKRVTETRVEYRAKKGANNFRERAARIYRRMLRNGLQPNSMSSDVLMLAMAKMGDLQGVANTLRQTWGVDVEAPPEPSETQLERLGVPEDSPQYPTVHTLHAVTVAFGSNGQVEVALRTVDYMSRRFNIPIIVPTWVALLNWTYVATRTKVLPASAVEKLWNIMCSPPYNVRPAPEMYDYHIRSLLWRAMHTHAHKQIHRVIHQLYPKIKARHQRSKEAFDNMLRGGDTAYTPEEWAKAKSFLAASKRRDLFVRSMIRRWLELLVLGKQVEHTTGFAKRLVPQVIEQWGEFLGEEVVYYTDTGYCVLNLSKKPGEVGQNIPVRRRKREWTPIGTGAKEEEDFF